RAHRRDGCARTVDAREPALAVRAGRPAGNGRPRLESQQSVSGDPRSCRSSERSGEHRPVVAIPVTLETLVGVVLPLEPERSEELRVAGLDLTACGPAVIRQVVAAARAQPPRSRRRTPRTRGRAASPEATDEQ